jgi:hypothetical protein
MEKAEFKLEINKLYFSVTFLATGNRQEYKITQTLSLCKGEILV